MAAATFHPELKQPPRKDGSCAIRIRITKYRKHAYWNVGKYVLPSQWNPDVNLKLHNYVIKHEQAKQYSNAVKNALTGLDDIADKNPSATAAGIKEAYEKALAPEPEQPEAKPLTFFEFAAEIEARHRAVNFITGERFKYMVKQFKDIAGADTPIAELFTRRVLHKYIQALKAKGNAGQTINNKLNDLKRIYEAGVTEKMLPDVGRPFEGLMQSEVKKKKQRPTAKQVKAFIDYQPKNELQCMAKTASMLQYLLQGARIGEVLLLEWANVQEKYVEYLPQKKAAKPKFVPRSGLLNTLLDTLPKTGRYVLPYIGEDYPALPEQRKFNRKKRQTELVNKGLKEIDTELKIGLELTSHMFRHAFADAIISAGSSMQVAAALLGHGSPATTEAYIKDLTLDDVSAVSLSIFDKLAGEQLGEQ